VCCSVLQCVALRCFALLCVAVCCSVLQCVAVCCSVLQCVAVCCSVSQPDVLTHKNPHQQKNSARFSLIHESTALSYFQFYLSFKNSNFAHVRQQFFYVSLTKTCDLEICECRAIHLQHTATHCNTLQHAASHYNTLQHTATFTHSHSATHCDTPQHTATLTHLHFATHCNTLQHPATPCNTLQHTATLKCATSR